jgi:predicted P-loop ATPase
MPRQNKTAPQVASQGAVQEEKSSSIESKTYENYSTLRDDGATMPESGMPALGGDFAPGLETEALAPAHLDHLMSEGFSPSHIDKLIALGVRSISEPEAIELGFWVADESRKNTKGRVSSGGIYFPFAEGFGQLRCDEPPTRKGKRCKYLTQVGKTSHAYLPDGAAVITEGYKDAAAGTLIGGISTGAIAGVSHYRKALPQNGGHSFLFDSDGWTNPSVFAALVSAAAWTGGKIQLIPEIEGQPKAGLCEYFKAGYTSGDYAKLIASAYTSKKFLLELPKHWAKAESTDFARLLRTVFALGAKYLSGTELDQLAVLCKAAGKVHGVPAPAINAELKRAQGIVKLRARRARLEARKALRARAETLDLTEFAGDDTESEILATLIRVRDAVGADLKLNRLTSQIEYLGQKLNPNHYQLFVCGLIDQDVSESTAVQILSVIAQKHSYHPALDYFESLSLKYGDSTIERLDNPATRLLKTSNPLYDVMLRKTLTAIVQRVYEPGCKWDYVMLLKGVQGLRKSTFWRETMPDPTWFDDNLSGDITNKDQLALLSRCVLQEWGEFDRITSSREAAELKSFVVRQNDVYRAPYERASVDHPRQSVIVGSVNKSEFLGDETGDRRYWVAEVEEKIDIDALIAEREELLAAAVAAYKAGELLYLSEQDEARSAENNLQYRVQDPWLPAVEQWLAHKSNLLVRGADDMTDWITTAKILTDCLGLELKSIKQYDRTRVEKILGYLGWQKEPSLIRLPNSTNPQRGVWSMAVVVPDAPPAQTPEADADVGISFEYTEETPQTQQIELGEWPIEAPTATTKPQWAATHRTADGIEFSLVQYLGREQKYAIGRLSDGKLLSKIDASTFTQIEPASEVAA